MELSPQPPLFECPLQLLTKAGADFLEALLAHIPPGGTCSLRHSRHVPREGLLSFPAGFPKSPALHLISSDYYSWDSTYWIDSSLSSPLISCRLAPWQSWHLVTATFPRTVPDVILGCTILVNSPSDPQVFLGPQPPLLWPTGLLSSIIKYSRGHRCGHRFGHTNHRYCLQHPMFSPAFTFLACSSVICT